VSPRFTSNGVYATANVSESRSSRKYSFSTPRPKNHERRSSHSQHRVSDHRYGALDDDEWARVEGVSYVQRLNTKGGVAPAGSCTEGAQTSVKYEALYTFSVPAL
jgi:hypothetical protein